ncbi:ATP synthase F1 subunit delta [Wenyingzhuangia sp. chi5]|uniref:ATP synthase subunit delta n=1 Tax=Wenyingzhuangia gilva TaxID=3057677 RepID=A0ABT8VPJ1_9FLAO|nr:ATP synthase F1 subunit delta [Wenyingzhuangia sp. chi5]MDO3693894.1 ATP synthase F1 subunit delta [Wenyingzhuangia sp. chi5]
MSTRAALRYAKAILNLAEDNKSEDAVNADMQLIAATIAESQDLEVMLKSPIVKTSEKVNALEAIFGSQINTYTLGLIKLLGEKRRLDILALVSKSYQAIYNHLKSIKVAQVITAVPLTKALESKVIDKIKALTGSVTTIENIINPEIIGGFVLRIGDIQYDASVSRSLTLLERSFDNSQFISKN